MNSRSIAFACALLLAAGLIGQVPPPAAPEVPYPDGYRQWMHISSGVTLPEQGAANSDSKEDKVPASHGVIHHIYANAAALEGYRTGHFPEGAVLVADWFFLEPRRASLVQGSRKSINVMVRDARYTETGGWGFEDFDQDSHTKRNIGPNAVQACFQCHRRAADRECVFSVLKP